MYNKMEFDSRTGTDYERVITFEKNENGVTIQTKHGHGRGCATKWVVLNQEEFKKLVEFVKNNE